jgi:hypothetical protein
VDWIVVNLTGMIREEISPACSPLLVEAARGHCFDWIAISSVTSFSLFGGHIRQVKRVRETGGCLN